ncbi:MAG: hypothetical protein GX178_10325 [Acidobacteria bacterium]|nr:hypothetical protein [Thermoanaerobaculia bacterium]NLN11988.1 hypothetical protein [Acidobacteriota bacterium]MBP7813151.1 hypothetical protein [Thermoanaerobaculia bacterium]MBP8845027.1 hypothetical protein [Thermoanaerobaculia bacterium]HPA95448.1 hypothetical protein [Thermoanaerobaculia bacterium]
MRTALVLSLLLFVGLAGSGGAQPAQVGGDLPRPLPLFPAAHWWNVDVSRAPVDPASGALIAFIGPARGLHPDFGGDAEEAPEIYGIPYVTVPGSQPRVPVRFDYDDESDAGAPGVAPGYPIPEAAKTQPKWIEGGWPGNVAGGGDRHLLLVDRDQRLLYELYDVFWTGTEWTAGSGAAWRLDESRRRPEGWTSADAAGLEILPGLVRYDEVYGPDPIRHAFRVTVRATNGYVFPASHRAGNTAGAPPLGTRLRLKAEKDLSGYPAPVRKIFEAMKTYGLIVADNGSDLYVTGTYDPRWDNDLLNPAFRSLRASDFEVIELGWRPDDGPPVGPADPCVPSATKLCLNGGRFHVTVRWRDYAGARGDGRAVTETDDSGLFWFFNAANLEMLVKVLDGCALNDRYWVFAAATTDVEYELTVRDAVTGASRTWRNPLGVASPAITDTGALAVCP